MKKLIVLIVCMLLLTSCGRDIIEFGNEENLSIVSHISTYDLTRSNYYSHWRNGGIIDAPFTQKYVCLVMPSNIFIVGDTINIDFIKIKRELIKKEY